MKATDQQIIDTIRAMSMKNYNEEWGWSVIVECFEDEDIVEKFGGDTIEVAIERARKFARDKHEAREEALAW